MNDYGAKPDRIYYSSIEDHMMYSPNTTQIVCALPLCDCGKEVKPGEDHCWTCLGEPYPEHEERWYVYGSDVIQAQTYAQQTYRYPISVGSSMSNTYTFTSSITQNVTGVTIGNQNYAISPGINVVSGDTIQFNITPGNATMSK